MVDDTFSVVHLTPLLPYSLPNPQIPSPLILPLPPLLSIFYLDKKAVLVTMQGKVAELAAKS